MEKTTVIENFKSKVESFSFPIVKKNWLGNIAYQQIDTFGGGKKLKWNLVPSFIVSIHLLLSILKIFSKHPLFKILKNITYNVSTIKIKARIWNLMSSNSPTICNQF